jgi:hypothetical protein
MTKRKGKKKTNKGPLKTRQKTVDGKTPKVNFPEGQVVVIYQECACISQ